MIYFFKFIGTESYDTIKMCLSCVENKTMAKREKNVSPSLENRNIKYTFGAYPAIFSVNKENKKLYDKNIQNE